jgi:hypothetical protein
MKRFFPWFTLTAILMLPVPAWSEIGYSGSTWGELRHEIGEDNTNTLLLGWVEQGIDWVEISQFRVSTYGIVRYGLDTDELNYNNYFSPGVGVALRRGFVRFGAEYLHEFSFNEGTEERMVVFNATWFVGWDLAR